MVDDHLSIGMLWKDSEVNMSDTRGLAMRRLMTLKKKFAEKPMFKDKYCETVQSYISKGYA